MRTRQIISRLIIGALYTPDRAFARAEDADDVVGDLGSNIYNRCGRDGCTEYGGRVGCCTAIGGNRCWLTINNLLLHFLRVCNFTTAVMLKNAM